MQYYRQQLDLTVKELAAIDKILKHYLNRTTVDDLAAYSNGVSISYYEAILSSLRRLSVFTEDAYLYCHRLSTKQPLQLDHIEKALEKIARLGIDEFFSPREDLWYENSRASYTNEPLILFREALPASFAQFMNDVGAHFETLREEMEIYHQI